MKLTLTLLVLTAATLEGIGLLLGETLFPLAAVMFGLAIVLALAGAIYAINKQWE